MPKIRVVVVDDSVVIRELFTHMLSLDPAIEVVGVAGDPFEARELIKRTNPDVITLDVQMPKMDGISFLEKIMTLRPMPVIMVSTLTVKGADISLQALELGAVDVIAKPSQDEREAIERIKHELIEKVKHAATAKIIGKHHRASTQNAPVAIAADAKLHIDLIAIGASTGGVESLRDVLTLLPAHMPPIVITQHMPALFTESFAKRLDNLCAMHVSEARDGMKLEPGHVVISKGGYQCEVKRSGPQLRMRVYEGEAVSGHCPSVDVLFHSAAKEVGAKAIGVILTGMGRDGAEGLLAMRQNGACTFGQNEASSVVYGMPRAAFQKGAVKKQLALADIPRALVQESFQPTRNSA